MSEEGRQTDGLVRYFTDACGFFCDVSTAFGNLPQMVAARWRHGRCGAAVEAHNRANKNLRRCTTMVPSSGRWQVSR